MSQTATPSRASEDAPKPIALPIEGLEPSRRRRFWPKAILLLVVVAAVGAGAWYAADGLSGGDSTEYLTTPVVRETLVLSVTEGGSLKSRDSVEVKCQVEGRNTIIWIIDEGKWAKKGDKLVELDASNIKEKLEQQSISFEKARASYVQAKEALEIQKNQNESNVNKARLDVTFAEMDLKKYVEGDWPQQEREAMGDIAIAKAEVKQTSQRLEHTRQLCKRGFVTKTELEGDELTLQKRDLDLQRAEEKLRLLRKYSHEKQLKEYNSTLTEARMALKRVERKAASELAKATADLKSNEATLRIQTAKYDKLKEQLKKTVIFAPKEGLVVYCNERRHWGTRTLIEEGAEVRERQKLIELPNTTQMLVETKVHESVVDEVEEGQPARITVDAFPDRVLKGHVTKVNMLPDPVNRWLNPELKVYKTTVELDEQFEGLKPGMSAEVTVILGTIPDAVRAPVQTVTTHKGRTVCYVVEDGHEPKPAPVKLGRSNEKYVQIVEGLEAGQRVWLKPPREVTAQADKDKKKPGAPGKDKPAPGKAKPSRTATPKRKAPADKPRKADMKGKDARKEAKP